MHRDETLGGDGARIAPRHLTRAIFVSLPARTELVHYVEHGLAPAIEGSFGKMRATSFRLVRQGEWLPQIEASIAYSNAVIAFLEHDNANVLIEIGEAYALRKPLILVLDATQKLPAMIQHLQVIRTRTQSPGVKVTRSISAALSEAVFSSLHREQSDFRTRLHERLLTGAEIATARNVRRANKRSQGGEADLLLREARRLQRVGDFQAVIDHLQQCIAKGLQDEAVFHLLADTWFLDGESAVEREDAEASYSEMLTVAESGLVLHPTSFMLRKDRALALLKLGRIDDSERGFRALLGQIDDGIIHYNLACVAAQRKDTLSALAELRTAMLKTPYYRALARVDPDFDPVWTDPLFQALVFASR